MNWEKKVWVVDDLIPEESQEAIKQKLLGDRFPWFYVPDVTSQEAEIKRPGLNHSFVFDGKFNPEEEKHHGNMLQYLWKNGLNKLKEKTNSIAKYSVIKSRAFLQVPLRGVNGGEYDSHHIDVDFKHIVFLYYVCDSDGDTVIFENMYSPEKNKRPELNELTEKVRVTPKQGRLVIFDGFYWHTGTQPTKNNRCVINTNIEIIS